MPALELEGQSGEVLVLRSCELGRGAYRVGTWISKEMLPGYYWYLRSLKDRPYRVKTWNSDGNVPPSWCPYLQDHEEACQKVPAAAGVKGHFRDNAERIKPGKEKVLSPPTLLPSPSSTPH